MCQALLTLMGVLTLSEECMGEGLERMLGEGMTGEEGNFG